MINKKFDEFKIIKLIGEGGVGKVYLALQDSLEREVVIKLINPKLSTANVNSIARFMHEAKLMASVKHPNIVNIYKVGKVNDINYIAMEYVEGYILDEFFSSRKFDQRKERMVWEIFQGIVNGLQIALQHGIIHRDIKPSNILINHNRLAKISDFGISKKLEQDTSITVEGMLMGSPAYISPEQASGGKTLYHTDMYSLGASIYHVLTGSRLFSGDVLVDVLYKQISSKPLSPCEHIRQISDASIFILGKLLHKAPGNRYCSYGDLLLDIAHLLAKQPLVYATQEDALEVFESFTPRSGLSTKTGFFRNIFTLSYLNTNNTPKKNLLWISTGKQGFDEILHRNFNLHYVNSVAELNFMLSLKSYIVLFDMNYLDIEIIEYLYVLKNTHSESDTILLISCDENSELKKISCDNNSTELLVEHINNPARKIFHARDISFREIVALIRQFRWTLNLWIDGGKEQSGWLSFSKGEPITVEPGKLKLTKTYYKWTIHAGELPPSWKLYHYTTETILLDNDSRKKTHDKNLSIEKDIIVSKKKTPPLVMKDEDKISPEIKNSAENQNKKSNGVVLLALKNTSSKYKRKANKVNNTYIYHPQKSNNQAGNYSSKVDDYENDNFKKLNIVHDSDIQTLDKAEVNEQTNEQSLATELDNVWQETFNKKRSTKKLNSKKKITDLLSEENQMQNKQNNFVTLMDKVVNEFLNKRYANAYKYLLEAKKLNPDAPVLKMNLKRLEKMGYGKQEINNE